MKDCRSTEPAELVIVDQEDAVVDMLRELQRSALLHPEAARSLFRSLVREGRAFAQTSEGARWKDRVLRSELLKRALLVWQGATLWVMEDDEPSAVPSALIDAVAATAASPRRDAVLALLLGGGEDE